MVDKYNGNSCKNARIKIDYNGLKPKVNFSYPDKKNQENYSMLPEIIGCWAILLFIIFAGYPLFTEEEYEEIDLSNYSICNEFYINHSIETCEFREGKTNWEIFIFELKKDYGIKHLFFVLFLIIPPFLIYYPFKSYWSNLFPKFQAAGKKGKFIIFKPKDIRKEGNYFVEIPLFNNVMLEYIVKKDFSKYLSYFEIKEYNFKYVRAGTIKKAMKSKKKVNESLWYAKFYFKKKPLNGKLMVLFK